MTKHQFLELYGTHVYQVRLSVACGLVHKYPPRDAIDMADQFVEALLDESLEAAMNLGNPAPDEAC
jgi:hypothetical protein